MTPKKPASLSASIEETILDAAKEILPPNILNAPPEAEEEPESEVASAFAAFKFKPTIMEGVVAAGFKVPSPIQEQSIPVIMEGRDVVAQANTGTGKTAAFGLPAMNRMKKNCGVELLVIAPTRELATQVSDELYRLGRFAGIKTGTVCGGRSYGQQLQMFERGIHVLSATPGRLLDLLESGRLRNFAPSVVVLDEADEMLDMGFLEDIQAIFKHLPEERQTLLFSATMPDPIRQLAEKILKEPVHIKTIQTKEKASQDIRQLYYVVEEQERDDAIARLMDDQEPEKAIVFCRTRDEVDRLHLALVGRGYNACALHGDMEQYRRQEVMGAFRRSDVEILVATDVAARGLDVPEVSHVFNFHLPFDSKGYIHRIGRTGRAGRKGTAITLVTTREFHQLERIRQQVGTKMEAKAVPGLHQLRLSRIGRLREALNDMPLHSSADTMVEHLAEGTDLKTLAARLLSMILANQPEKGPDQIGLTVEELEQLQRRQNSPKPAYSKGGGSRGGYRGGPRAAPRGGYGGGGRFAKRHMK